LEFFICGPRLTKIKRKEKTMRRCLISCLCLTFFFSLANISQAHFGVILPDQSMVMQGDNPQVEMILAFCHPFEQQGMPLAKPKAFGVQAGKGKTDLLKTLQETKVLDQQAWKAGYTLKKPGVYVFYFDPQPYWEPAEDKYIIHQTKTYVAGFGAEEGWDREVGLKAEIVPLTRPFGLYAGNVFQGLVKFKGKPVPYADVEVEYWNTDKKVTAPNDYFITQVVKTDKNGVFTFAPPQAGWWGFSALNDDKNAIKHTDGTKKDAEYGAVLWVQFTEWPGKIIK
jgi:cobalt/nickel transport protein